MLRGIRRTDLDFAPLFVLLLSHLYLVSHIHLQMSVTSNSSNSTSTITASSCSSTSHVMGNLSSGTGSITTTMGNVSLSSGSTSTNSLNAHSALNYTQGSLLPSSSSASCPASSSNGVGASHVAPGCHPHSGSNSGKSVELGPRASAESHSSLATNLSSH